MWTSGSFRIYKLSFDGLGPQEHLVGRIWIDQNQMHILEDHYSLLTDQLPEGEISDTHQKVLDSFANNGYFKIIHEDDLNAGHHEDKLEELNIGNTEPDHHYVLQDVNGENEPISVEVYGEKMFCDGKEMTEEIENSIKSGILRLVPL